jgi:hypothetical protein
MKIKTKFSIGQTVYGVRRKDTTILKDCPVCNGTTKIKIANFGNMNCPECWSEYRKDGKTYDKSLHEWYVEGHFVINCIRIQLLDQAPGVRYKADYDGISACGRGEHHLFPTIHEAEQWCKEVNEDDPMSDNVYHGVDIFLDR